MSGCDSGSGWWMNGRLLGLFTILVDVHFVQIQSGWHGSTCLRSSEWVPSILCLCIAVAHDVQGTLSKNGGGVDERCLNLPCNWAIIGKGVWCQRGVD